MEMKVFGISFRIEIVIACLILGMIIGGQVFCSCFHTETAKKVVKDTAKNRIIITTMQ
jgi:ligand-binding sensor protein